MAVNVILSNLGVDITEAVISGILKHEGEDVKRGETIATVESQKVAFEVVSPLNGTVLKVLVSEGDVVQVGRRIAIVGAIDDDITELANEKIISENLDTLKSKQDINQASSSAKISAYPAAKEFARKLGVDLSEIVTERPGKAITKEDVLRYISRRQELGEAEVVNLDGTRAIIAHRLTESLRTAAHVTSIIEVDMTEIVDMRRRYNEQKEISVTFLPFVIRAIAKAICDVPIVNSTIAGNKISICRKINLSLAVSTERGLLVPVISSVEKSNVEEISVKINAILRQIETRQIRPEDMRGGTITLSNGGVFGTLLSTPIINQPQVAIVWMGRIEPRPTVIYGSIVIRDMMYVCLSYDHRVMDGKDSGTFLAKMKGYLERVDLD